MGSGSNMGWMWLFWILLVVGVTLLVVVAVRALGGGVSRVPAEPPGGSVGRRARDVLDERYARGEISTEEYRERRRALGGDS
jgi:putative membrane protein